MKPSSMIALLALAILWPGMSSCLHAQGLRLTPGAHLVISGVANGIANTAPVLVLDNASLINDGNITAGNGTILFTGDGTTIPVIGGANPVRFNNLTLQRSVADLRLDNDAAVSGQITLGSGNLQLNGHNL